MAQKTQTTPTAGRVNLKDVEFPCDIFGTDSFYNYLSYTQNLFGALIMALTAEDSSSHTLATLIKSRIDRIQEALEEQYKADREAAEQP